MGKCLPNGTALGSFIQLLKYTFALQGARALLQACCHPATLKVTRMGSLPQARKAGRWGLVACSLLLVACSLPLACCMALDHKS